MIQLSRAGVRVSGDPSDLERLKARFAATHVVRLPHFIADDLAALVDDRIARARFVPRIDDGIEIEDTPDDAALQAACHFLMNDPRLFSIVERITGCAPLGRFTGRIYRRRAPRAPGEHYYPWHDDVSEDRRVGISVNLGRASYEGGALQLRDAASGAVLAEVHNREYGGAVLFRISLALQHRVTPVSGECARTAWAGWFRR